MLKTTRLLAATAALCLSLSFSQAQNTFPSSGKVGIGTTSPGEPLHMRSNTSGLHLLMQNTSSPTSNVIYLSSYGAAGQGLYWTGFDSPNTASLYASMPLVLRSGSGLIFSGSSTAEHMRIGTNGNVGIGTQAPGGYKLAVAGKIGAWQEVHVYNTGVAFPDYVFDRNYRLLTLNDLEAYIQQHKHLPEVPSAKEVAENGMGLVEMQTLAIKKVEELTLYLIDLNKQLQALKQKNAALEAQLAEWQQKSQKQEREHC